MNHTVSCLIVVIHVYKIYNIVCVCVCVRYYFHPVYMYECIAGDIPE